MAEKGRVIILMMDSFGIGGAKDAARFGDEGADTLGHITATRGHLNIPNLSYLGCCARPKYAQAKLCKRESKTFLPF